MPFSTNELANIASSLIDYHEKGPALAQSIQDRPLYDGLRKKQKFFPAAKEFITTPVKGDYTTTNQGYSHDDTVSYTNPANTKRAQYKWYEQHCGISCTETELKAEGISVTDENGSETSEHDERELVVLTGLLSEKIDDMNEGSARDFNLMLWQDGSQDAKDVPGIRSIITDNPLVGTVGGLSGATLPWWRNRARTASYASGKGFVGTATDGRITSNVASGGALIQFLQEEWRQLRRYGGAKRTMWLAGSDFISAMERELRANGNYTDKGFSMSQAADGGMADIAFKGNAIVYDPTLDDLGLSKRLYIIDMDGIRLRPMTGEDWKQRSPARPATQYVLYRAKTWTGGLDCKRRNSNGVYEIN
jgi:hypothetical protein